MSLHFHSIVNIRNKIKALGNVKSMASFVCIMVLDSDSGGENQTP